MKDEDSNKVPWLNCRFRGSIFYNDLQSDEPLIVRQAMVELGSDSEPPPPSKNNKLPGGRPIDHVDMLIDELKEERARFESTLSEASEELGIVE